MLGKLIYARARIWLLMALFVRVSSLLAIDIEIDGINYRILESSRQAVVIAKSESYYSGAVNIPTSVEYDGTDYEVTGIEDETFYRCSELTSVVLPNGLKSIGEHAFRSCTKLSSVVLPSSLLSIGEGAFRACSSLSSIALPDGVTSIEFGTFSGCWNLATVSFGRGLTSIGDYAFSECSALTSVEIPSGVHTIELGAFKGCSRLTSVKLPQTLTMLIANAFEDCTNLLSVYCYAEDVPSAAESAFEGCYLDEVSLYVPQKSIKEYSMTEPWNRFGRIEGITSNTDSTYYLVLWLHEGEQVYFPFESKPCITYSDGDVIVATSDSETRYQHTDVRKFTITTEGEENDDTAIDNLFAEQVQMSNEGGSLVFTNCSVGERVHVYDISGRLHKQYSIDNSGRLTIPLSQYTSGIYVVKMKNITYKFSRK